jgi:hypothetical protein
LRRTPCDSKLEVVGGLDVHEVCGEFWVRICFCTVLISPKFFLKFPKLLGPGVWSREIDPKRTSLKIPTEGQGEGGGEREGEGEREGRKEREGGEGREGRGTYPESGNQIFVLVRAESGNRRSIS